MHIILHALQVFVAKNIKTLGESTEMQKILLLFCRSGSVSEIIPNAANTFTKLNPARGIETAAQINEELNKTNRISENIIK